MDLPYFINIGTLLGVGTAACVYLQMLKREREDMNEILWKILEQLAKLNKDTEVMNGFAARSGRILRPRRRNPAD